MARVFAYCRVSKTELTTENQIQEIAASGFAVEPHRIVTETISGSSAAAQRPEFQKLVDRLERDDVLVLTKLDRLGRNTIDVIQTVERLAKAGVRVHCLQLGGTDLTSPSGRLTMTVLAAVAQFERDLIIERTKAGLARAEAEGKRPGRKPSLNAEQVAAIRQALARISQTLDVFRTSGGRFEPTGPGVGNRTVGWLLQGESIMKGSRGSGGAGRACGDAGDDAPRI